MRVRRITTTAAITTLLGAGSLLFAGVAFAESSSQIDQTSTVEVTNTQDVTINNQVTSSSTVDGVTTTVSSDTSFNSPQVTTDENTTQEETDQAVTSSTSNLTLPTEDIITAPTDFVEGSVGIVQQAASPNNASYDFFQVGSSDSSSLGGPTAAAAAAPVGQAPTQPVSGALHQFDAVLATLVSSSSKLFDPNQTDARLPLAASAVLALLLVIIAAPTVGQYVNRLRRAGYTHAARSDMSAGVFTFVTPLKVSFAWADSPAASSSFYRSNWSVASGC